MNDSTQRVNAVADYLKELPEERKKPIAAMRQLMKKHLPKGLKEVMGFGMICYVVPLSRYPKTYNGQPLCYAALAAQKNFNTAYLMSAYACTECGRCTSECPAHITGKKLSPRKIMMDTRDRMEDVRRSLDSGGPGLNDGKTLLND